MRTSEKWQMYQEKLLTTSANGTQFCYKEVYQVMTSQP
jgi:hypothetical protein